MIDPKLFEQAEKIIAQSEVKYTYFFDHLNKPDWIPQLLEMGYFKNPPLGKESEGYLSFPVWPASRYLLRMAEVVPEQVLEIALILTPTNNERVHEDFTQAALKMPPNQAAQWAQKETEWLQKQEHLYLNLPYYLGNLIEYLVSESQLEAGLNLAKALLEVRADPKLAAKMEKEGERPPKADEFHLPYYPQPQIKFNQYVYKRILENQVPALVRACGLDGLTWLCNLFATVTMSSLRPGEGKNYSHIWRPSIADNDQNKGYDLRDPILVAVRNAAESIVRHDPDKFDKVIAILERGDSKTWGVRQRLALHLIRIFPESPSRYVREYLLNKSLFETSELSNEYWLLARDRFDQIKLSEQQQIIEWMLRNEEQEKEKIVRHYEESHEKKPTRQQVERLIQEWLFDELNPIKEFLPEDIRKRYDEALKVVDERESSKMPFRMETGWIGPTSPLSEQTIGSMAVAELVQYMMDWQPPGMWDSPTRDGFARVLAKVVGDEPQKFASECVSYLKLHPIYVRGFIEGFNEAVKAGQQFDWEPILELCVWVINKKRQFPPEVLKQNVGDDRDETDWGWTRSRIANLMEEGFRRKENAEISFKYRERVWAIIESLTNDPEPSVREKEETIQPFDAAMVSINTVRGRAMHAVMFYIMWVRRHLSKQLVEEESKIDFSAMPEVVSVLDDHLDVIKEPTLTIRSVYGRWFPWLTAWDESWARDHVADIFPEKTELQNFWDTAWGTYMVYNRPYDNVFPLIKHEYEKALTRLGEIEISLSGGQSPDENLAGHIMLLYGRGLITLEEGDLIDLFFQATSARLRGHALSFIGESLHGPDPVPPEILERFKTLWDRRMKTAKSAAHPEEYIEELAAFGDWIASGRFPVDWAIENLLAVLILTGKVRTSEEMIHQLSVIAPQKTVEAIEALRLIVKSGLEPWDFYSLEEPGKNLLRKAIAGGNQEAKEAANDLVNVLVRMGHLAYRDLIKESDGE